MTAAALLEKIVASVDGTSLWWGVERAISGSS